LASKLNPVGVSETEGNFYHTALLRRKHFPTVELTFRDREQELVLSTPQQLAWYRN
jgi:hypothetical protein